jgi:16S rRNA (uracil1498-N3)-methyltransferase
MSLVPFVHVAASLASLGCGGEVPISRTELHHLGTVLRLRAGAMLEVADGAGWWATGTLTAVGVRLATDPVLVPVPSPAVAVAQALGKGRKLDEVVRQVTELGVDRLVPVEAARSVSRPAGVKAEQAVGRWRSVARAAAEQSRRAHRPEVTAIHTTAELLAAGTAGDRLLVAQPGGPSLPQLIDVVRDAASVTVAVGPEGGWTPEEVEAFGEADALPVGLGPTILRTEHAAAAAVAVLAAGLGRWRTGPPGGR